MLREHKPSSASTLVRLQYDGSVAHPRRQQPQLVRKLGRGGRRTSDIAGRYDAPERHVFVCGLYRIQLHFNHEYRGTQGTLARPIRFCDLYKRNDLSYEAKRRVTCNWQDLISLGILC
jgi:hypothetical protein